jgi:hypothetical protein
LLYEVFRALLEGILRLLASHGFFRLTNQGRFCYGHAQMGDDISGVVTAFILFEVSCGDQGIMLK